MKKSCFRCTLLLGARFLHVERPCLTKCISYRIARRPLTARLRKALGSFQETSTADFRQKQTNTAFILSHARFLADSFTNKLSYTLSYIFAIIFLCVLGKLCNLVYEIKFTIIIMYFIAKETHWKTLRAEKTSNEFPFKFNGIWSLWHFSFWSDPIQFEREWKHSFLSALAVWETKVSQHNGGSIKNPP